MFCELEHSIFCEGVCNLIFGYDDVFLENLHGHYLSCLFVSTHHHLGGGEEGGDGGRMREGEEGGGRGRGKREGEREDEGGGRGKKGRKYTSHFGHNT